MGLAFTNNPAYEPKEIIMTEKRIDMNEIFEIKSNDAFTRYVAQITRKDDHFADFIVHEISSWNCDGSYDIADGEVVLKGMIKWDGCSHINFGDESSGYMHLCGKLHWHEFTEMLPKVYEWVASNIKLHNGQD